MQAPPSQAPPSYAELKHAVLALQDEPTRRVRELLNVLFEQAGAARDPIDWSDPDRWIDERLSGELRALARKIWEGSGKTLNPRYFYGCHAFINRLKLLRAVDGVFRLDERGRRFLVGDDVILRELVALRSVKRGSVRNQ
jgi:restriction system protein